MIFGSCSPLMPRGRAPSNRVTSGLLARPAQRLRAVSAVGGGVAGGYRGYGSERGEGSYGSEKELWSYGSERGVMTVRGSYGVRAERGSYGSERGVMELRQ